jgi:antitoxin Phd
MSSVSVSELRSDLSDTVNRVAFKGERVIVERQGKQVAAMISIEDLELLEKMEDAYWAALAEKDMASYNPAEGIPEDEFWKSVGLK